MGVILNLNLWINNISLKGIIIVKIAKKNYFVLVVKKNLLNISLFQLGIYVRFAMRKSFARDVAN